MKHRFQAFRVVTLVLCVAMLLVMLLPGSFPYRMRTSGNPEGAFYGGNYFPEYSWAAFFCWGALGAGALCLVLCVLCLAVKKPMLLPVWICMGAALFLMYRAFCVEHPLQFWSEGYYLPIVPPLLAGAAMVAALVETLRGRKKKAL